MLALQLLKGDFGGDHDAWLTATLQRAAGTYHCEKVDDRGLSWWMLHGKKDCDGQAADVVALANAVIKHGRRIIEQRRVWCPSLVAHLCSNYCKGCLLVEPTAPVCTAKHVQAQP